MYIGSGTDLPLCDEGRAQLEELKDTFDYPHVPLVFTSPMLRATQTADVLFPGGGRSSCRTCGRWLSASLKTAPSQLVKDPEFAQWMDPTSRTGADGAEDRQSFLHRTNVMLMKMFEYMLRTHTEEAACVTHGGVIMNMLANRAAAPQAGGVDHRPRLWLQPAPGRRNVDARPSCRSL